MTDDDRFLPGLELARRFYEDGGVSGAVEDRPGLAELLAELHPGDVVIVALA